MTHPIPIAEPDTYRLVITQQPVAAVRKLLEAADYRVGNRPPSRTSILDLVGLGANLWQGTDPRRYVADLRDEWEAR